MRNISMIFLAVLAATASGVASAQSVKFTNVTPNITIPLATSSSVQIDTNGDVIASCATSGSTCQGLPSGSSNPPTVSISGSTSATANNDGTYTAPITYTIVPSASGLGTANPEICSKLFGSLANVTNVSGWSGTATPPLGSSNVTLSAAGDYQFRIRCFAAGGAAEAVTTKITLVGGSQNSTCTNVVPPPGFSLVQSTWNQLFGGTFQFPQGAPGPRYFGTAQGTYLSVSFVAPDPQTTPFSPTIVSWDSNQQLGGTAAVLNAFKLYVTVSECSGDFRVGVFGATDTTSYGCRSVRRANTVSDPLVDNYTGIVMVNGNSSWSGGVGQCGLTPGKTYYLNYINQDIRQIDTGGSWSTGTNLCGSGNCGVQITSSR